MPPVIAEVRMLVHLVQCCASGVSGRSRCSRQASDRDRPCATLRFSLNPVRSSIVQELDLRLLPTLLLSISRSPSIFLFLSVFLADKCVFQVMSINKSMSTNKKLLSQIGKTVCFFYPKMPPFKTFSGLRPEPRWGGGGGGGLSVPPDLHLQSTSIHRWLCP